ncbi:hypothetical protein [Frigoriflavimonas asaccharolytica]|uniref:TonB-like protein n=1 Tax=Frigoriflavimonas asaccharolytica TaxID=2735899 RepID=A0A8J8G6S6_9FLAO|nr:hypothetical protein [Frigoriflavimonas asaccharolytica]NRS92381.1 hypothetical protein [Frigoriflavimonas asaccharolytica]
MFRFCYLSLVFFFSLNFSAQITNFSVDKSLIKKAEEIREECNDSISHYSYKKNEELWKKKYSEFYLKKMVKLKTLYEQLYNADQISTLTSFTVINGKEKPDTANTISEKSIKQASDLAKEEHPSISIAETENFEQLADLNIFIRQNFPQQFYMDGDGRYTCQLKFLIDVDGKFKKIKYNGEKAEFNLLSAIYLYSIQKLEKPLLYKGNAVKGNFQQPITLIIQ